MRFQIMPHRGHLPLHVSLPWLLAHSAATAVLGMSENEDSPLSTQQFTPFHRDAPRLHCSGIRCSSSKGLKTIPVAASLHAEPILKAEGSLVNCSRVGAGFI